MLLQDGTMTHTSHIRFKVKQVYMTDIFRVGELQLTDDFFPIDSMKHTVWEFRCMLYDPPSVIPFVPMSLPFVCARKAGLERVSSKLHAEFHAFAEVNVLEVHLLTHNAKRSGG